MINQEARFQAVATAGAVLIAFIGVVHEVVGAQLFPWGPALFGGPIGWHGVGIACIAIGLLLAAGTLKLIAFPVLLGAGVTAAAGLGVGLFTAIVHREFHLFAFTIFLAGTGTVLFHQKASRL
jgi:hypothetical protein